MIGKLPIGLKPLRDGTKCPGSTAQRMAVSLNEALAGHRNVHDPA